MIRDWYLRYHCQACVALAHLSILSIILPLVTHQAPPTTMTLSPLRPSQDHPSAGPPIPITTPCPSHIHSPWTQASRNYKSLAPPESPASSHIGRSTARLLDMNGSSARSHTVSVTSRGLSILVISESSLTGRGWWWLVRMSDHVIAEPEQQLRDVSGV